MQRLKFDGLLKEILKQPSRLEVADAVEDQLGLPRYKAEALAARIEKKYPPNLPESEAGNPRSLFERVAKPDDAPVATIYAVGSLSAREFARFIKWQLTELGYEIQPEQEQTAIGINLVVTKNDKRIAVQALRCPQNYRVSEVAVFMAKEAMRNHACQTAMVITTGYFTSQATEEAQKGELELWDKESLQQKIAAVTSEEAVEAESGLPPYSESLLQSLLQLEVTKDFMIEARVGGKYDLYLPGVRFPLLTFQVQDGVVVRCVFRIINNEAVGEYEGVALIRFEHDVRVGPDGAEAYGLVVRYLEDYLI
ncbi:MAG: restriction endonuclease [Candidatus Bathyarchaeota archaeon]|nr:restriction endonuclease [Candidatus Bathyarchaeota archaeon]